MYEEFYGLISSPFRLSPDPAFIFGSSGHQRALAYLRYGLNQKEGFIVITGAPGTGKTTLARALLEEIGKDKVIIAELSTTRLEADDVLRMVAASFGLEYENLSKASLLKRLESFCISRTRAGYHILLLVDEAQNLPYSSLEELRMLSNFHVGKDALIQIFLLGQEQFRNSLYGSDLEQLRQRVVASSHLDPMSQSETREYIEHRLKCSGWSNNPQISDRAFVRIFSLTKGVPRRINTFCERLLLYGALEKLTTLKDEAVKTIANELMLEVSAKGVKLSDIEPGVPDIIKQTEARDMDNISPEAIDSEILNQFSDDIPEIVAEDDSDASEAAVDNQAKVLSESETEVTPKTDEKADEKTDENKDTEEVDSVLEDTTQIDDLEDDKPSEAPLKEPTTEIKKAAAANKRKNKLQPLRVVGGSGNAVEKHNSSNPETESPLMDTKPEWWDLVALAVTYYREPEQNIDVTSSKSTLLPGIGECFKIAIGKMVVPVYLRTGILSGATDDEIREALRFYVKGSLLSNTADYYRRLGVDMDASFEQIRTHYKYLFRLFQPDKEKSAADWDETFTRRINQAYGTLRSSEKRKDYDEFLTALNKRNINLAQRIENADIVLNLNVDEVDNSITTVVESANSDPFATEKDSSGSGKGSTPWLIGSALILVVAIGAGYFMLHQERKTVLAPFEERPEVVAPSIEKLQPFAFEKKEKPIRVEAEPIIAKKMEIKKPVPTPKAVPVIDKKTKPVEKTDIVLLKDNSKERQPLKVAVKKPVETVKKAPAVSENKSVQKVATVTAVKPANEAKHKPVVVQRSEETRVKSETASSAAAAPDGVESPEANVLLSTSILEKAPIVKLPEVIASLEENTGLLTENLPIGKFKKTKVLTQEKLREFVIEFSMAYEEGNLDAFMTFFTDDASTNDAANKFAIQQNYKKLFSSTDMRVIDLGNLKWKIAKRKAIGKGDFVLTVLGLGGGEMKKFSGLIKLELVPVGERIKLKGMFHAYGEDT